MFNSKFKSSLAVVALLLCATVLLAQTTQIVGGGVLSPPASGSTPTLAQAAALCTGFTSPTCALASSSGVGDTISVFSMWGTQSSTLTSFATTGCTTGTWTYKNNPTNLSTTASFAQGYAVVTSAGTCTVHVTLSASAVTTIAVIDCANCGAFDVSTANANSSPGNGTNAITSGSMTTTAADFVVCGTASVGNGSSSGITAGTGFTGTPASQYYDGSGDSVYSEYELQGSAGAITGTFTTTSTFQSFITGCMGFK